MQINNKNKNTLDTEKYQDHIPSSFADKFVCIDDKFSKRAVLCRGKNEVNSFTEAILEEYCYCKKEIKKFLHKNLVMFVEDERRISIK